MRSESKRPRMPAGADRGRRADDSPRTVNHGGLPVRLLIRHPFRVAVLSLALCAMLAVAGFGTGIDGLQAVTRYTGRVGALWFALLFALSPWHALAPSPTSRLALVRRRSIGLAFGLHHGVHLALLLAYVRASNDAALSAAATLGALAYLFLLLMIVTSTDAAVARLGRSAWRRLHRAGLWMLWLVFFLTYLSRFERVAAGETSLQIEWLVPFAALALALIVRVRAFSVRPPAATRA
jgi:methionine sulfoxide reductase heme-binding subunit